MVHTYLDEGLLARLIVGHTFDVPRCVQVIESALADLNKRTGLPDGIAAWLHDHPMQPLPVEMFDGCPRIIMQLSQSWGNSSDLTAAMVLESKRELGIAPGLFLMLHSPVLDIPMRVEIPLRAVFKQGADVAGGYTVYLHALMTDDGEVFKYYGITRRPWNLRFLEHVKAGQCKGAASRRLFARRLSQLILARLDQRFGKPITDSPALAGVITTLCLVGGTRDQALNTEEVLVDRYSLASKHKNGLNMIPGGTEGVKLAQRFRKRCGLDLEETTHREVAVYPQL